MRGPFSLTGIGILLFATAAYAQQERRALRDRPESFVAATRTFRFYSDPVVNLHDFLYAKMQIQGRIDARSECTAGLPPEERDAFERARAYYEREVSTRPWFDELVIVIRYELAGFSSSKAGPQSAKTIEDLRAAVPAYRRCWWTDHDARNRNWIAELVPRLIAHEDALRARLGRLYQGEWRIPMSVDVVGAASPVGANSLGAPDHLLISSADSGNQGLSGLEIVFHEASHSLLGPGLGAVWKALQAASAELDLKQLPPQLWHAIIFYTTGRVVETMLAERGSPGYLMYMDRGVFKQFREPLGQHWQPYLENRATLQEAAKQLLAAFKQAG